MLELDSIVRQNQLACLPISKSGRAEDELLEQYPELVDIIERSKQTKVDMISLQTRTHEIEGRAAITSKSRSTLLEDFDQSPSIPKSRLKAWYASDNSPSLKARSSAVDLMFEMDDDENTTSTHKKASLEC